MHRSISTSVSSVKSIVAENTPIAHSEANCIKNRGPQRDRNGLPDMETLSLGDSVSPAEKILLVLHNVVHVNIYTAEAPPVGDAHLSQVPATGTSASDGSADIPTSRDVPRRTATQGEQTTGPQGEAIGSPVARAAGQSMKPEADSAAIQSPQLQSCPTGNAPSPITVGNKEDEHIAPQNIRHKGKWYVVTKGRRTGVWTSWTQMSPYVTGVRGNCHQSFASREEALKCYLGAKERGLVAVIRK